MAFSPLGLFLTEKVPPGPGGHSIRQWGEIEFNAGALPAQLGFGPYFLLIDALRIYEPDPFGRSRISS